MLLARYIAKNVISATLIVVAILVGIESFMLFFNEVGDIGKHDYTLTKASAYVFLQLPFNIYELFPMAGFLGCLIGLGRLANTSELVAMRASGVSIIGITAAVLKAAMVMLIVMTFLGEVVAPKLSGFADKMKAIAIGNLKRTAGNTGIWLRNQDDFLHISHIYTKDKVGNLTNFVINQHQLKQASTAPAATRLPGNIWEMQNVDQTKLQPQALQLTHIANRVINVNFDPVILSLGEKTLDQLTLKGLSNSIRERSKAGLNIQHYRLAFWQRVLQPVATLIMICLGVPFMFGSLRHSTMGLRILVGILVGFTFYTINQFVGPMAIIYQLSPLLAASLPPVIFISLCGILLRRIK